MRATEFITEDNQVQPDLFPDTFADKTTSLSKERTVSSRGDTETINLPNLNSKGQRISSTKQGLENFWNWFGDSEAVDSKGRPQVFLHGTSGSFQKFDPMRSTANTGTFGTYDAKRSGIFFSKDNQIADAFADKQNGNVAPVYLRMNNPADFTKNLNILESELERLGYNVRMFSVIQHWWELFDEEHGGSHLVELLKKAGYDSAIINDASPDEEQRSFVSYVVFDSNQVKSAIGNKGTYSKDDPDFVKEEVLDEMPLPADWDPAEYGPKSTFKSRLAYAIEKSKKLGTGSSRVAFVIDYQGRPTVLKIAKNKKGLAQNAVEAEILEDNYAQSLDIVIPLIDYDTANQEPLWVHTEKADKATEKQLCQIMKCDKLYDLVRVANSLMGHTRPLSKADYDLINGQKTEEEIAIFTEYATKLAELGSNYNILLADFGRAVNWGLFHGKPIVLDVGFNESVRQQYYLR